MKYYKFENITKAREFELLCKERINLHNANLLSLMTTESSDEIYIAKSYISQPVADSLNLKAVEVDEGMLVQYKEEDEWLYV